ncbi:MAG: SbmA/BacA-like family transporter [Candidatus Binatia bacterium]|jgi:putative ATP-binding cassette transporter
MADPTQRKHTLDVSRVNRRRFTRAVRRFLTSEVGGKARGMLAVLVGLLLAISGLNVLNSYVGRDFMTAIADRNTKVFVAKTFLYVCVFAILTVAATIYRFTEERLGLLWREWLTRTMLHQYLNHRMYYHLNETDRIPTPDQRIAEDARSFAVTTLSFMLLVLNGTITALAFSGVLWSISPLLFGVAVGYAVAGSALTIVLGRALVHLNYTQADMEAFFRTDLVHIRENAEWVAFLHREGRLGARLTRHLDALIANFKRIIAVNRNLSFFTTGYNYLIQIIPIVIVAPLFIRGKVEFGVITQAAIAFAQLMGAFSLIVTQIQSLSSYAAVLARLGDFMEASGEIAARDVRSIELKEERNEVAFDRLTLRSPRDGRVLIYELSLSIPQGTNVLIRGDSDTVKVALVRALAGIWECSEGRILRPGESFFVMPERPYLPPGTLREVVVRAGQEHLVSDAQLLAVLHELELDKVVTRVRGLDTERDWNSICSLEEQHFLVLARLLLIAPRFALLDRIGAALSPSQVEHVLDTLSQHSVTYMVVDHDKSRPDRYNAVLDLHEGGSWKWMPLKDGQPLEEGIISGPAAPTPPESDTLASAAGTR